MDLRPSRTLTALLATAHLASAALIWTLPADRALQMLLVLVFAASWLFHFRRDCRLSTASAIVHLRFKPDGACRCLRRDGHWFDATLHGSMLVSAGLSVLNLRPDGHRLPRHVVLFPDSLAPEAYRRLRVRLRWARPASDRQRAVPPGR